MKDVNGDGRDDLIVGAHGNAGGGNGSWDAHGDIFGFVGVMSMFAVAVVVVIVALMGFFLIVAYVSLLISADYIGEGDYYQGEFYFLLLTAALGATFVGMQAFEWTKLITQEGIRPWGNPLGAAQFGASFFMITGFHGTHVSIGVIE